MTDPNGHTTTNTWDANGNLLSRTDALSQTSSYTYNSFNEVLTATDPLGVATTNSYDPTGNLTRTTTPLIGTTQYAATTFSYDPLHHGDLTQMTDPNGKVWRYAYDSNGLRNRTTDPLGDATTFSYDNVGRLQSTVSPKGNVQGGNPSAYTTIFTFDGYGGRLSATDPLGHLTTYKYDLNRNLTVVVDGNNKQTTFAFDGENEPVQIVKPDGSTLRTVYDGDGNVTQQIDGLGHQTTYQYNGLNQRTKMTDPLSRSTQYTFDGVGNLLTIQNPKDASASLTMGYDQDDQLKTITYSDGQTPNVTYAYDADGQRRQMIDGTGTSTYTMDSLHRLTQNTNGAGAQVQYSYDLLGHVTSLVYPGGISVVTRTYDDVGRLASLTDWLRNTTRFSYDPNNNLVAQYYPNGVTANFTYDATDRAVQIVDATGSQLLNLTYTRDGQSQVKSENSAAFGYDPNNRVTSAVTGASPLTYQYDAGDNLTNINGGTSTTQVYDAANQLQTATTMNGGTLVQKYTYGYDANGNRISRTDKNNVVTNTGWDQTNRQTAYGAATYSYNGDGLRMSKTVSATTSQFVWDIAEGLPLTISDGAVTYVTGSAGLPLEQISGAGVSYFHRDQLGSTRLLTNALGQAANTYNYDPYGNLVSQTGTAPNPFLFQGQYQDVESGLYYLRARYYDASVSQFIGRDPAVMGTREPYAYTVDNPLNGIDPTGLDFWGDAQNFVIGAAKQLPTPVQQAIGWGAGAGASGVGGAHDFVIGAQADLDAGLGGDARRGLIGVGKSFLIAAAIVGTAAAVRGGLTACVRFLRGEPEPPGFDPATWEKNGATRDVPGKHFWDPDNGEWRYHPSDPHHPDAHWDYNPWDQWNSPWQHR